MTRRRRVDLARARAAEAELEALLKAHPELGERTARYLAGELPARGENVMSQKVVKLPEELFDRAAALVPRLAGSPEMAAAGRSSIAAVLRVALSRGLASLEEQYGAVSTRRGKQKMR